MKPKQLILSVLIVGCGLLILSGCEEETASDPQLQLNQDWFRQFDRILPPGYEQPTVARTERIESQGAPKIAFESVIHDFGDVGLTTNSICEFRFTNIGTGILKIEDVVKTCGCTPFELEKTEYAPGESGILKVQYYADKDFGRVAKNLVVHTNDSTQPEIELAIVARVVSMVEYEPKALGLMLKGENAGCPQILLSSIDNKPFSITYFRSTANCITADFDPSAVATSFVLEPKVDMVRLARTMEGNVEIGLTHPECKIINLNLSTVPRFRVSPGAISLRGIMANMPVTKKVVIANNYDEDFEVESSWSKSGVVKMLSSTRLQNGYELELQITPPASDRRGVLSDTFFVRTKDGDQLEIPCTAFYAGTHTPSASARGAEKEEECKTCGPKVIDPVTGKLTTYKARD